MKAVKANIKFETENRLKPFKQFQLFNVYKTHLFTEKISPTTTIHPGIFGGRALSIRVFLADGHYGLIVALRGWALSRHVINLNQ